MTPNLPPGQGPIDPLGAIVPPPNPAEASGPTGGTRPAGGPAAYPTTHPSTGYVPPRPPPTSGSGQWPSGQWPPGPPFFYPPPPRRGIGRFVVPLLLLLMLGGSVLLNLLLVAGSAGGMADEPAVVTQTVNKGDPQQTIAVVELAGEIDDNLAARFDRLLDRVEQDADVRALVVEIDSPGGTVTASDEIYARLLRYKTSRTNAGKPAGVVVAMRSMATSGGYYAACAADHVVAEQTTMTGNIGVLMTRFNVSGLMQKWGVDETTIVASGADYKNAGSPFSPETAEGQAYLKGIVDDAFARFKQVVTTGRGPKLTGSPTDVFNGKVFTASQALKLGLIDQIGYPDDAYAHAATKVAGLTNPHVVRYREPTPGLLGVLFGGPSAAGATGNTVKPGAAFPVDLRPETLDAWRTNRLLYR